MMILSGPKMVTPLLTAIMTVIIIPAALGGCDGGPDIIDRHDYSSFYDFGGFDDTAEPDDSGTDLAFRDEGARDADDTAGDDVTIREDVNGDEAAFDIPSDTTTTGPTVTFVTDKAWETRAKAMIGAAKSSVDVVHLEFLTYSPEDISIAGSLKSAAGRGVQVRLLLDDGVESNADRVDELDAINNIQAKLDNGNITTHVKMIIVDDGQVLVGSTNLSKSSLHFNHEANLYITDGDAVPEYVDYFEGVWTEPGSRKKMTAAMTGSGILPIGDGEYVDAVGKYINDAHERILLVMYDLKQDSGDAAYLTDLMLDAEGRGVDVKVFFERCNDSYAEYVTWDNEESADILETGGAEVKFDEPAPDNDDNDDITHAKLLVVDDTVVVYSGNWNNGGLNNNHEAGAVVDGVDSVTTAAVTYFNGLWTSGVDWP